MWSRTRWRHFIGRHQKVRFKGWLQYNQNDCLISLATAQGIYFFSALRHAGENASSVVRMVHPDASRCAATPEEAVNIHRTQAAMPEMGGEDITMTTSLAGRWAWATVPATIEENLSAAKCALGKPAAQENGRQPAARNPCWPEQALTNRSQQAGIATWLRVFRRRFNLARAPVSGRWHSLCGNNNCWKHTAVLR